jgi:hypothetical protein
LSVEERRSTNRKAKNRKLWTSARWRKKRKEYINACGGHCSWCGSTEYLVVHHPFLESYEDNEVYLNFYLSGCIVLCRRCHFAVHKGLVLCPRCKKNYCSPRYEHCYSCLDTNTKTVIEERKEIYKMKQRKLRRKYDADKRKSYKDRRAKETGDV